MIASKEFQLCFGLKIIQDCFYFYKIQLSHNSHNLLTNQIQKEQKFKLKTQLQLHLPKSTTINNTQKTKDPLLEQPEQMKSLLQKILGYFNHIDNKISGRLHQLDNIIVSCILYPFAAFFHPGLIWIAFLSMYFFSNYNLYFLIVYVVGVLLCLLTIFLLKKALKRDRPLLVQTSRKPHHFRKKQKNHAMPSGDAIQSALFVVFLSHWNVPLTYLIIFHIGVCLGRVYYMCHWIADTVVASVLGMGIAWYFLGAYEQLKLSQITGLQL